MSKFKLSFDTTSYVRIGETIKLNASYDDYPLVWTSLDENIATVSNGFVKGIIQGIAKIKVSLKSDESINTLFYVSVIENKYSEALEFVIKNHNSNIFKRLNLGIGAGHTAYYTDILSSVNKLLFNEEYKIDYTFYEESQKRYGEDLEKRVMESVEFITVHYTGNMRDGANAKANASWFAKDLSINPTSIHYCTGNDGIFKGLEEKYMGAHAGDYSSYEQVGKFTWRKTGIKVSENDPKFAKVTINENGNFSINGIDTHIQVPVEKKFNRGIVTDNKWLNNMGLGVKIIDNEYYLGTAWWCYTQVGEGRICSTGGNHRSIGIESCVNEGSDLWYTWQITARLVADIMLRWNLDITKVLGHHAFSAKNCPQPLLENNLELWHKFIELVEVEHEKLLRFKNDKFELSTESSLVNNVGRVKENKEGEFIFVEYNVNEREKIKLISLI